MSPEVAKARYHKALPLRSISSRCWGPSSRTGYLASTGPSLWLSVVYCLGHLSLAFMDVHHPLIQGLMEPRDWLLVGLILISVGSGGIKPCLMAHVGDQFGKSNAHLMQKIFGWFYFSINLGAFLHAADACFYSTTQTTDPHGLWDYRRPDGDRHRLFLDGSQHLHPYSRRWHRFLQRAF